MRHVSWLASSLCYVVVMLHLLSTVVSLFMIVTCRDYVLVRTYLATYLLICFDSCDILIASHICC